MAEAASLTKEQRKAQMKQLVETLKANGGSIYTHHADNVEILKHGLEEHPQHLAPLDPEKGGPGGSYVQRFVEEDHHQSFDQNMAGLWTNCVHPPSGAPRPLHKSDQELSIIARGLSRQFDELYNEYMLTHGERLYYARNLGARYFVTSFEQYQVGVLCDDPWDAMMGEDMWTKYMDDRAWDTTCKADQDYRNVDDLTTLPCPFDDSNCTWRRKVWGKTVNGKPVCLTNMPLYHNAEEVIDCEIPFAQRHQPQENTFEAHLAAMEGHRGEAHPDCQRITSFSVALPKTEYVHRTPDLHGVKTTAENCEALTFLDCPFRERERGVGIPCDFRLKVMGTTIDKTPVGWGNMPFFRPHRRPKGEPQLWGNSIITQHQVETYIDELCRHHKACHPFSASHMPLGSRCMCVIVRRPDFANMSRSPQHTNKQDWCGYCFGGNDQRNDEIFTFGGGEESCCYGFSRECSTGGPPNKKAKFRY